MENCKICPVCSVRITGDTVIFSHGKPGTRERLYARVCQYAKDRAGCINPSEVLKPLQPKDYYLLDHKKELEIKEDAVSNL